MHLTDELLGIAQAKLQKAEAALAANPTNRWLKMSVSTCWTRWKRCDG